MGKGNTTTCGGVGDEDLPLLPEDFLIQILVRLPVVSLLRFKSVCKSWLDLIQTSFFIHLHTTFNFSSSKQLGGGSSFILQASRRFGSEFLVFSCASGAGYGSEYRFGFGNWFRGIDGNWYRGTGDKKKSDYEVNDEVVVFKLDNLESPQISYDFGNIIGRPTDIVGSCNGLICLFDSKLRDVFLWNPATRQSRILPKSSSLTIEKKRGDDYDSHLDDTVFCAFGFDVKTKDYKVLLITYFTPKTSMHLQQLEWPCGVEVYSLSTDSWKLLEGINSLPGIRIPSQGSLYHHGLGSYFFVGRSKIPSSESLSYDSSLIISFDFTKEIFNTMRLPDHDDVVQRRWYLSCLGEKLALFSIWDYNDAIQGYNENYDYTYQNWADDDDYENDDYGYEDCYIWVLNEHGGGGGCGCGGVIKESWTKLHFFQIKRRGPNESIIPRGILNNGEFALLETRSTGGTKKKMQLYNLVTKEAKTVFLVCRRLKTVFFFKESQVKTVEVYKPSLVSIIGGNGAAAAAATDRVIGGAI